MKKFLLLSFLLITGIMQAQDTTGSIAGKLSDREMSGEPLPFANVLIKGSTKGTTSDYDGLYILDKLQPGTYTLVFSFVGYETLEVPNVVVEAGKVTEVNTDLGSSAASLDEVVITTVSRRDSEVALLIEQKNSVEIKESIGAVELAKMGVSDAATATTKISGVTSSEASGDIFVRGLGDRYLYTTMNGLPIPSDDVERKNIDLGLFPTRVIQNISISKTYAPQNSADLASGSINIASRELRGKDELDLGLQMGVNTNAVGQFSDFKVSPNQQDVYFGFYDQFIPTEFSLNNQQWDPQEAVLPINRKFALTAGKEFGDLRVLFTAANSTSFEYNDEGIFRDFRANILEDEFTDVVNFKKTDNNTALLDLIYEINDNNRIKATSLFINKVTDEVFEAGRNGEGRVEDEDDFDPSLNQFIRDQNIKQTRLLVNQLHGFHDMWEGANEVEWAVGYNMVDADEPNRIRNEINFKPGVIQLAQTSDYQQRKSNQEINDTEFNAFIKDQYNFIKEEDESGKTFNISFGGNYRNKERDFYSKFYGTEERTFNTVNPSSLDNLTEVFSTENFNNGLLIFNNNRPADLYNAILESGAAFASVNFGTDIWNVNLGARYQIDRIDVAFDVNNYNGEPFANKDYSNIYPSLNLKYSPTANSNIRFAASRTITLPEFKEIAPFEYVSPTAQITKGNPELEASTNYNFDLKYEIFPSSGELLSLTGFYKRIKDPINKAQQRGSAGRFSYFNAGEQADIYGLELEARMDVIENENEAGLDMAVSGNITRMWHSQDLKDVFRANGEYNYTFRYGGKDEIGLQGASDWIVNTSINVSTETENPYRASLVAYYASDKIFSLGNPETANLDLIDVDYNDEIVEKGIVTLDLIMSKELGNNWELEFKGQNLLNPEIERYQAIKPQSGDIPESNRTVRSYTRGAVLSLGVNYSF